MNLSISYHPISPEQMREWYFNAFEDMGAVDDLKLRIPEIQLKEHSLESLETFYLDKYKTMISRSRELDYDDFNKWHAYFIAIVQGFFEKFYFVHGASFSAILENEFHDTYVSSWEDIIEADYLDGLQTSKKLVGEFSGGAYISPKKVKQLLHDYKNNEALKEILDEQFFGKKIDVLLDALNYASSNNQGLLEATRVIDNKEELFEEPKCFSNVFNCDVISAAVYTSELAEHFDEIYQGDGTTTNT